MILLEKLREILGERLDKDVEDTFTLEDLVEKTDVFEEGWFNSETGEIDETKIKDETVRTALVDVKARYDKMTPEEKALFEEGWYDSESNTIDESKIVDERVLEAVKTIRDGYAGMGEGDRELFEDGWFDATSGAIDETKIKDETVRGAVRTVRDKFETDINTDKVERAIDTEFKENYVLSVRPDTAKKMLNRENITIDESGNVVGVKEAIEALKTDEPGLFKDKEKESNPLNEGFNPATKPSGSSGNFKTFAEAFKMMD